MNDQHKETAVAMFKIVLAWIGAWVSKLTLSEAVMFVTLVFTLLQTYVLLRDKFFRRS